MRFLPAATYSMIPKSGDRFSEKIMLRSPVGRDGKGGA